MRQVIAAALFLLVTIPVFGWGQKGHYLSNEAATYGTPSEMPGFFHRAYPQLVYLSYDPDRWRDSKGKSLDALNPPDHFLDYEYVEHLELPPQRYKFIQLLSDSGTLRRFSIESTTPGFLPWRIAEMCELLEVQWRLWRQRDLPPEERQQVEANIIQLAGTLGHYVADAANPHHASIHYNGWVGWPNTNRFPNDCDTHNRFETQFVSRVMESGQILPRMSEPKLRSEYFNTALGFIRSSVSLIDPMYRMDRDGGFRARKGTADSRAFTATRLAAGASLLRDLWWSTYRNSAPKVP